jgi:hypothetical protein
MSWVEINDGRYAVSNLGEVMSLCRYRGRSPKIMKQNLRRGYLSVMIDRKQVTVHSLVAKYFIGPRDGMHINHKDGVKTNNTAGNLEYVTASDNQKHSFRFGLQSNKGENHSQHKLTEAKVKEIISSLRNGSRVGELSIKYGINQSQISHIKAGRAWRHIDRKAG